MAELLGTHSYQLDPKGRISLPGRFREAFADGAVLTLGQDGCLFCFPRAEWTARAAEIRDLLLSDTEGRAYARPSVSERGSSRISTALAVHSALGKQKRHPSCPSVRTAPSANASRNRPGRLMRPFGSS